MADETAGVVQDVTAGAIPGAVLQASKAARAKAKANKAARALGKLNTAPRRHHVSSCAETASGKTLS